jgi:two-component system OmpR family sensor kinase
MPAIAWLRPRSIEAAWLCFAAANYAGMLAWPAWETIPFHLIWVSLTLLFGYRLWRPAPTYTVLTVVGVLMGAAILVDALHGSQEWGELFEVPLMSAMFLAMVWHARRRQDALASVEQEAARRAVLLERQERFLHDASHELRTPVTIARGHLELLGRLDGVAAPEVNIALDELGRIEAILDRLLLLAKADRPDFLALEPVDLEAFLEDVLLRWAEVAPRAWQLGPLAAGTVLVDPERLREALDALLENAVKYSEPGTAIEIRSQMAGAGVSIEVADEGRGIEPGETGRVFERFARVDAARGRSDGGVGLGLAIVDAIAKAHGGRCGVRSSSRGSTFSMLLPRFASMPSRERVGDLV